MQVLLLAKALKKRGHDVHLVSLLEPTALKEELHQAGISLTSLRLKKGIPDPRAILSLSRIYRRYRPNLVHSHMVHANFLARAARVLCDVPALICTAHSEDEGKQWVSWGYRLSAPLCDTFTNVSERAVQRFVDIGAASSSDIQCVENAVKLEPFAHDKNLRVRTRNTLGVSSEFLWLAVGRLQPVKDFENLVLAASLLKEQDASFKLFIVGSGLQWSALQTLIDVHQLHDHVELMGQRRDISALMSAADAFVLSSRHEGLPMVLLEAGAASLPSVCTRVGGSRELCEAEFVVPTQSPRELCEAMIKMQGLTSTQRRQMGQRALSRVRERFSLEQKSAQWEALYRAALGP